MKSYDKSIQEKYENIIQNIKPTEPEQPQKQNENENENDNETFYLFTPK